MIVLRLSLITVPKWCSDFFRGHYSVLALNFKLKLYLNENKVVASSEQLKAVEHEFTGHPLI